MLSRPGDASRLDVTQVLKDGTKIRYLGPYPLTALDLRVLQGLTALAGVRGRKVGNGENGSEAERRQLMAAATAGAGNDAMHNESLYLHETFARLAVEIGMLPEGATTRTNGRYAGTYARSIRASLDRLFATSVFIDRDGEKAGFHLISKIAMSSRRGELWVLLNPSLSAAILGGPHVRIEMSEVRSLRSDAARLIHQRLCALLFPGERRTFQLQTILKWLYAAGAVSERGERKRAASIEGAISELAALGWAVETRAGAERALVVARPERADGYRPNRTPQQLRPTAEDAALNPGTNGRLL